MERAVTLFPQPLSPTRQTVSPASMVKDTSSIARNASASLPKSIFRFLISSNCILRVFNFAWRMATGNRAQLIIRLKVAPVWLGSPNMRWQTIPIFIVAVILTACSTVPRPKPIPTGSLDKFQKHAEKFNEVVTVPTFETTTDEVAATTSKVIADGNAGLDRISQLKANEVNFTNTIRALDDV